MSAGANQDACKQKDPPERRKQDLSNIAKSLGLDQSCVKNSSDYLDTFYDQFQGASELPDIPRERSMADQIGGILNPIRGIADSIGAAANGDIDGGTIGETRSTSNMQSGQSSSSSGCTSAAISVADIYKKFRNISCTVTNRSNNTRVEVNKSMSLKIKIKADPANTEALTDTLERKEEEISKAQMALIMTPPSGEKQLNLAYKVLDERIEAARVYAEDLMKRGSLVMSNTSLKFKSQAKLRIDSNAKEETFEEMETQMLGMVEAATEQKLHKLHGQDTQAAADNTKQLASQMVEEQKELIKKNIKSTVNSTKVKSKSDQSVTIEAESAEFKNVNIDFNDEAHVFATTAMTAAVEESTRIVDEYKLQALTGQDQSVEYEGTSMGETRKAISDAINREMDNPHGSAMENAWNQLENLMGGGDGGGGFFSGATLWWTIGIVAAIIVVVGIKFACSMPNLRWLNYVFIAVKIINVLAIGWTVYKMIRGIMQGMDPSSLLEGNFDAMGQGWRDAWTYGIIGATLFIVLCIVVLVFHQRFVLMAPMTLFEGCSSGLIEAAMDRATGGDDADDFDDDDFDDHDDYDDGDDGRRQRKRPQQKRKRKQSGKKRSKGSCFPADALVAMHDGTPKRIADIVPGDCVLLGGHVDAVMKFAPPKEPLYCYRGIDVTGEHAVRVGQGRWARVRDAPTAVPHDEMYEAEVYDLITNMHRIVVLNSERVPIVFADYEETEDTTEDEERFLKQLQCDDLREAAQALLDARGSRVPGLCRSVAVSA